MSYYPIIASYCFNPIRASYAQQRKRGREEEKSLAAEKSCCREESCFVLSVLFVLSCVVFSFYSLLYCISVLFVYFSLYVSVLPCPLSLSLSRLGLYCLVFIVNINYVDTCVSYFFGCLEASFLHFFSSARIFLVLQDTRQDLCRSVFFLLFLMLYLYVSLPCLALL
jgi:hypothetical protein